MKAKKKGNRHIANCEAITIKMCIRDRIYDEMIDFAKYAFNKSHAAAYAFVSYQTAWLKYLSLIHI